jgi:hypothetical protein
MYVNTFQCQQFAYVRPSHFCFRDNLRTTLRILTKLHKWTCIDNASDEFANRQITLINSAHINYLIWHLIGRNCLRDNSRTTRRILTKLHQGTCIHIASNTFNQRHILPILISYCSLNRHLVAGYTTYVVLFI